MAPEKNPLRRDSSYFQRLGMQVELERLEKRASELRTWLSRLPARIRRRVQVPEFGGLLDTGGRQASGAARGRGRRGRRRMSAEARKRISDAQKARWATKKAAAGGEAAAAPARKRARVKRTVRRAGARAAKGTATRAAKRAPKRAPARSRSAATRRRMAEAQRRRRAKAPRPKG